MPDYDVIADVSKTLEEVLTDALTKLDGGNPPIAELHDLQGSISTSPARLTIFLFEAVEDPSARNRPPVRELAPPRFKISKPPMALLLRYLLTAWSGDPLTDHKILGRAIQALYDNAILSGPTLKGSLAGTDQALKLKLVPLTLEERTRVWYAVHKPYRFSVTYEVRVVNLDTEQSQTYRPALSRQVDYSMPEAGS